MTAIDIRSRRKPALEAMARAGQLAAAVGDGGTLEFLQSLCKESGDILPDDVDILLRLAPHETLLHAERLRQDIDQLVRGGQLRRIVVGHQFHLAFGPGEFRGEMIPAGEPTPFGPDSGAIRDAVCREPVHRDVEAQEAAEFDLMIALDIETERILLYRVSLVILSILGFVLLRSLVLETLGY